MRSPFNKMIVALLAILLATNWCIRETKASDLRLQGSQPARALPTARTPVNQPTPVLVSVSRATPNRPSVSPGGSAAVTLSGSGLDGITSVKVGPDGISASTLTTRLGPGSPSSRLLTIAAGDAAAPGTYTVKIAVEGGRLIALPATLLSVVVEAPQALTSPPTGMRIMGTPAAPPPSRSASSETESAEPPALSRRLEPGSASSDRLQDQTTAGLRSSAVTERMSRLQQGRATREMPGSSGVSVEGLTQDRGSLSSRLEANRTAMSQNPALDDSSAGPLGENLSLDTGTRDLAGKAEQFRSAGQSPGGMSALNPAKNVPDHNGFTVDSRLASGTDAPSEPAPAGTPKPNDPGPDSDGDGSGKKVVTIVISKKATKEEVQEAFSEAREENPDAEIRAKKVDMTRYILGKVWSKFSNESKDEVYTRNATIGVRGQCPPESMTCGLTGKTWAQLSSAERKQFCEEFESELDQVRSTGEYDQGSGACDAENLQEPDWGTIMEARLGPYILTDEDEDSGIIAPVTGSGWTKGDLVDTLPDPGEPGSGTGGAVNPQLQ